MSLSTPERTRSIVPNPLAREARRPLIVLGGAILAAPFALYLGATPRFRFLGPLLWLFLPAAAFILHRGMVRLAWLFLLPFTVLAAWLAWVVLNQ